MNLRRKASETLTEVQTASKTVAEAANWQVVALVAVSAVSLLALGVALTALSRTAVAHEMA